MKKHKILGILILVAVLVLSLTLSACDILGDLLGGGLGGEHTTHNFDSDWTSDSTHHWHKCKGCDEVSSKTEHVFSEWKVDTAPTETTKGSRTRSCLICEYVDTDTIPALGEQHAHKFDQLTPIDEKTHIWKCRCGELSDEGPINHIFDRYVMSTDYHTMVCDCGAESDPIDHVFDRYTPDGSIYHNVSCACGRIKGGVAEKHLLGDWIVDKAATTREEGSEHRLCELCGYREDAVIPRIKSDDEKRSVDLYGINDFHGTWNRMSTISGYLAEQRYNNSNTVFINSGDMFQGSMESNSNFGALLAECMDDAGFDAFVYGNHEFDWGLDNLRTLAANSTTPYLGANIYNWTRSGSSGVWGTLADFAKEYVIKDLDNGLRVGIIGVIGKDQITSISSQLVQTIGFKDPKEVVPSISNKLRNELGCDVVIVSAHTGQETFLNDYTWDITQYADAVFCAHTHTDETYIKNGVPFIQTNAYGKQVSHIKLEVESDGFVSCESYENIGYSYSWPNKIDMEEKINNSNAKIADEANEVLATLTGGYLNSGTAVPRLVSRAIAEYATEQGYEIEVAIVNNARSNLQQGNITYTKLYEAIPFDNEVYIARISGKDLIKEVNSSGISFWRVSNTPIVDSSSTYYKVAVIDYLLFHQNANRQYNYLPSAFTSGFDPVPLTKQGVDVYNYRLITRDWLKAHGTVSASDYTSVNDHTNKDLLSQTISLSLANYATSLISASQCAFAC